MSKEESKEKPNLDEDMKIIKKISKEGSKDKSEDKGSDDEDVAPYMKGMYSRLKSIDVPMKHTKKANNPSDEVKYTRRVTFCGAFSDTEESNPNSIQKRGSILKTSHSIG